MSKTHHFAEKDGDNPHAVRGGDMMEVTWVRSVTKYPGPEQMKERAVTVSKEVRSFPSGEQCR